CRDFGGKLAIVSQDVYDDLFDGRDQKDWTGLHDSPFTCAHGLHWRKKIIYAVRGREEVGSIIHEMGHVFAAQHHPERSCGECHEWNWFGWEIAIARQVDAGRTWSRQNHNYQTGEGGGRRWGRLSAASRRHVITKRLTHAKKIGVVASDGTP